MLKLKPFKKVKKIELFKPANVLDLKQCLEKALHVLDKAGKKAVVEANNLAVVLNEKRNKCAMAGIKIEEFVTTDEFKMLNKLYYLQDYYLQLQIEMAGQKSEIYFRLRDKEDEVNLRNFEALQMAVTYDIYFIRKKYLLEELYNKQMANVSKELEIAVLEQAYNCKEDRELSFDDACKAYFNSKLEANLQEDIAQLENELEELECILFNVNPDEGEE